MCTVSVSLPVRIWLTMLTALSIGIAKPMFEPLCELNRPPPAAAVFMPMILRVGVDRARRPSRRAGSAALIWIMPFERLLVALRRRPR